MASIGSAPILQAVLDCLRAFRNCLRHPELCYFEDQLGRFNLWSSNINASSSSRSSLDSRLKDSEGTRNMVVQLLRALEVNLVYSLQRAEGKEVALIDNNQDASKDGSTSPTSCQSDSSSSTSSISSTSEGIQRRHKKSSELLEIVKQVRDIITRLQQLSRAIRKASQQDRTQKIAKFEPKDPGDVELRDSLREHAKWLLYQYYPRSAPGLRTRLLEAILLRQKRFFYRKSRGKESRTQSLPSLPKGEEVAAYILKLPESTQPIPSRLEPDLSQNPKLILEKSIAKTSNTVSAFDEKLFALDALPSRQPAMSVRSISQDKDLEWPAPPKRRTANIEAECPYCFDFLTEDEISDVKLWQHHMKNDLEPYNCYFDGCQDPILTFKEFHQWLDHVREVHTPHEWFCTVKAHTSFRFSDQNAFRHHMISEHPESFTDSQLDILVRMNSKPLPRPFSDCPLCAGFPNDCTTIKEQDEKKIPDTLPRHIAGHLKALAMLSLPPGNDVDQATASKGSRISKDTDVDRLSLAFSDRPHVSLNTVEGQLSAPIVDPSPDHLPGSETIIYSAWLDYSRSGDVQSHRIEELGFSRYVQSQRVEEWGFSNWTKYPTYTGHLNDIVLQNFVDKAQSSAGHSTLGNPTNTDSTDSEVLFNRTRYAPEDDSNDSVFTMPIASKKSKSLERENSGTDSDGTNKPPNQKEDTRFEIILGLNRSPDFKLPKMSTSAANPDMSHSRQEERKQPSNRRKDKKKNEDLEWGEWSQWEWDFDENSFIRKRWNAKGQCELQREGSDAAAPYETRTPPGKEKERKECDQQEEEPYGLDEQDYEWDDDPELNEDIYSDDKQDDDKNYLLDPTTNVNQDVSLREPKKISEGSALGSKNLGAGETGLHNEFKVHESSEFKKGRVFKILWSEPHGATDGSVSRLTLPLYFQDADHLEQAYSSIRRFIIVKAKRAHCMCVPILTYGLMGTAKAGVKAKDHAIIYTSKEPPVLLPGERFLAKTPIKVRVDSPRDKLAPESRVNYSKVYTVEHNVKVCFIGSIHVDSEIQFYTDFQRTFDDEE